MIMSYRFGTIGLRALCDLADRGLPCYKRIRFQPNTFKWSDLMKKTLDLAELNIKSFTTTPVNNLRGGRDEITKWRGCVTGHPLCTQGSACI